MLANIPPQLCIQCFKHETKHHRCPQCGFDEKKYQSHPLFLAPRTVLKDQYIIGKTIGQGGFGVTYLGIDTRLDKKVAIKEYLPAALVTRDLSQATVIPIKRQENAFQTGLQFFIEEARNLAKFTHPHIVRVMNFFEANHTGYMVMEYLQGQTLSEILNRSNQTFTVEQALTIMFPLLDALQTVHDQHVYHRDISAHNVFILEDSTPILIDFGAARHIIGEYSQSLDLVLKHGYSPLEQYSGKGKIGPWTDIYACGALLYLLMTGKLPSAATDRYAEDFLVPPNSKLLISESLNQAILQALAVKIEKRFQSIKAFKLALEGKLVPPKPIKPKSKLKSILVTFILLIGLASLLYYLLFIQPVQKLLEQARQQWSQSKLIVPAEDNVYATYQQILVIEPQNAKVKIGLKRLVQHYIQSALHYQTQSQFEKSLSLVQQGLTVFPNNSELQQLQTQLNQTLAAQQQLANIEQLIQKAKVYLASSQQQLAYQHYQRVLNLNPQHIEAKIGLQQIATNYVQILINEPDNALLEQALALFPENTDLKRLQADIETQKEIVSLQQKATRQLANIYLTEPRGNNAYETYQKILVLDPNNGLAQTGLNKIADAYEKLAYSVQKKNEKSLAFINKGLLINPTHPGLLKLKQQLMQPEKAKPVQPLPPPVEKTLPTQPSIPVTEHQDNKLQALLKLAQQQFETKQLESAVHTYHNVLALEPGNLQVRQGLDNIVLRYEQLAQKAYQSEQLSKSLNYIEKALNLRPNHPNLNALQNKITQQQIATTALEKAEKLSPTVENETNEQPTSMIFTPTF